jgi:hypothetical protein
VLAHANVPDHARPLPVVADGISSSPSDRVPERDVIAMDNVPGSLAKRRVAEQRAL